MRILQRTVLGLAFLSICGCAFAGPAQAPPAPGYVPVMSQLPPIVIPPYVPPPSDYAPGAPSYAPNGSTGYAPYSQDVPDAVVHDGSNGRK
jgi:hypothetical protein